MDGLHSLQPTQYKIPERNKFLKTLLTFPYRLLKLFFSSGEQKLWQSCLSVNTNIILHLRLTKFSSDLSNKICTRKTAGYIKEHSQKTESLRVFLRQS